MGKRMEKEKDKFSRKIIGLVNNREKEKRLGTE